VIPWLLDQGRPDSPDRVSLVSRTLRHNRSCWVEIDQLAGYWSAGEVDARRSGDRLTAKTEGVRALSLGPLEAGAAPEVVLDGQDLGRLDPGRRQSFRRRPDGAWERGAPPASEKRHGCSGPMGDLFFDGLLLVPGTSGSEEEAFFHEWVAGHAAAYFRSRNGGVHRGGIMGQNTVDLPIVRDADLTAGDRDGHNLLLYGTPASNSVMAEFAEHLPVAFEDGTVRLGGRLYRGDGAAAFALFPHPRNPRRCVAVHGGATPDAVCWGSHLDMQLLPDYLVYAGGEVLDWGFWDNDWRAIQPVMKSR